MGDWLRRFHQQHWLLLVACSLIVSLGTLLPASSEPLPPMSPALKSALYQLDPGIKIREDAFVTFTNGSEYVLIASPEARLQAVDTPVRVKKRMPDGSPTPDLLELSDGRYLLRMITLPNGRKTFPILEEIPLPLRAAMLAQNFSFPSGFLLPTAWKSLTGNLLLPPDPATSKTKPNYPLAMLTHDGRSLMLWDVAQGQAKRELVLPCQTSDVALSPDATQLFGSCETEPTLYAVSLPEGQTQSYVLPAPARKLAMDAAASRLYLTYPTEPRLGVFDVTMHTLLNPIELKRPATQLVMSPFRKRLYVALGDESVLPPAPEEPVEAKKSRRHEKKVVEKPALPAPPVLQMINLATKSIDKDIPTLPNLSELTIQDEKVLWMLSAPEKTLWAFDLRWQEYSPKIALSEMPVALASDDQWLYLLTPSTESLQRLNLETLQWGEPIPLEPGSKPAGFTLDPFEHQAFVFAAGNPGIQVVNLNRGEWVGTQKTEFQPTGRMAWVIPQAEKPDRQVRIRFQDGRLLLQNARQLQSEK